MWMVEHLFTYGWDDADWHDGEEPLRFATRAEAEAELSAFLADAADLDYSADDFRVVPC